MRRPSRYLRVLSLAACVGYAFDLAQLAAAAELSPIEAVRALTPAVHDGKWREIKVEISRGEFQASTKPGYFAK